MSVYGLKGDKLSEPKPSDYQDDKIVVHNDDEVPSIAIIPFDNKGDDEDAFYTYGISADLISDCSSAGLIRVTSLKQIEELGEKSGLGYSFLNMGNIDLTKGEYDKALVYYNYSFDISNNLGDKYGLGWSLCSYGFVYEGKGDYDKALDNFDSSLELEEETGYLYGMGRSLYCIGYHFWYRGDLEKAVDYLKKSLKICEKIGNKSGIGRSLSVIGCINYNKGLFEKAKEYLDKSIAIQKEIHLKEANLLLETTIYLYFTYRHLHQKCDIKTIHSLIKETEYIIFNSNYRIYQLLEDASYLETAYNQIQEKADNLGPYVKLKFLSYPIPKAIVEEWEKVK